MAVLSSLIDNFFISRGLMQTPKTGFLVTWPILCLLTNINVQREEFRSSFTSDHSEAVANSNDIAFSFL